MAKFTLTPELFQAYAAILRDAAGLNFDPSKLPTLQTHVRERAHARHQPSLEEYLALLRNPVEGPAEVQRLVETVTIHETCFFRNQAHFQALQSIVFPALAAIPGRPRHLRIWSAGCATGEEAYSLAIAALTHPALAGWKIEVLATDVSERALEMAREGSYSSDALRYVPPDQVRRWFTTLGDARSAGTGSTGPFMASAKSGPLHGRTAPFADYARRSKRRFCVADEVRRLITFQQHNLSHVPYDLQALGEFDLVACENVLIYFDPARTKQVIEEFYHSLRPDGYLFLGYSETLWRISDAFQIVTTPATFFYRRPGAPTPARPRILPSGQAHRPPAPTPAGPLLATRFVISGGAPPRVAPPPAPPPKSLPPLVPRAREAVPAPATASVETAIAQDPAAVAAAQAQAEAGRQLLEEGQYDQARQAFMAAIARYPACVAALVGLAQIHANQGQPTEAIAECRRALSLDSLCEEAHLLLALLYRQQHQIGAAIDHYAKAIYINFESVPGHYHLAELYRGQGDGPAAAQEYRTTLWALDRTHSGDTISGIPVALIRKACEQQLNRYLKH